MTNSLKSALQSRVNVGVVEDQAGARLAGHFTALCGSNWPDLQNDIFGRPVTSNTLDMRGGGASCNNYSPYEQTVTGFLVRENLEKPYLQISPSGTRGAADLMGKGRDLLPVDLYGQGLRGSFIRLGSPGLTLPQPAYNDPMPPVHRREQNLIFPTSHDLTNAYWPR
jgi:hypothetical protein